MVELFAGPLVRWYRQDFPGGTPLGEPPDPADVATLVARWQAAYAPAIGPVTWPEELDQDVWFTAFPQAEWDALLSDAAAPRPLAEARALRPREVPAYPLLHATAWIPVAFDGILPIGLPDRPDDGSLASGDRLRAWVRSRQLARWAAKVPRDAVDHALACLADGAAFAATHRVPMLAAVR